MDKNSKDKPTILINKLNNSLNTSKTISTRINTTNKNMINSKNNTEMFLTILKFDKILLLLKLTLLFLIEKNICPKTQFD